MIAAPDGRKLESATAYGTIRRRRRRGSRSWSSEDVLVLGLVLTSRVVAVAQETTRVSVDSAGVQGNANSGFPSVSADGQVVAFDSNTWNLVPGDTNAAFDAFVHARCSIDASRSNDGSGFPGTYGVPPFTSQQNPSFGATSTLDLANSRGLRLPDSSSSDSGAAASTWSTR
jgi:hypothetical protein